MFSYIIKKLKVTFNINGKPYIKRFESENSMYEFLQKIEASSNKEELFGIEQSILKDKRFYKESGKLYLKGCENPLPNKIANKLTKLFDRGLSIEGLVMFWVKCHQNEEFRAIEELYNFIVHNGITIDEEGNIIGWKKVTKVKDGYKPSRNKNLFTYKLNVEVRIPYDEVDNDKNNTCSFGLHVGSQEYATNFQGNCCILVKVNPKDVVSVPTDYNGQKLRCCAFTPIAEL